MDTLFIAHRRESDGKEQTLQEHLQGVAQYAREYSAKLGLADIGELLGLLHDLGKYGSEFQNYIKSATGMLNPDEGEYVNAKGLKGKIDHSTAGAQLLWQALSEKEPEIRLIAKAMALCLVSHHSGLIDSLSPDGKPTFLIRINKMFQRTHFDEVWAKCDKSIKDKINNLLSKPDLAKQLLMIIMGLKKPEGRLGKKIHLYKIGQLVRILFSCLIDADRTDTCIFERPHSASVLLSTKKTDWKLLINRLDVKLHAYQQNSNPKPIDGIRAEISEHCKTKAKQMRGIFTLTVPTGGGKTLASLRFALLHAEEHKLDRIIYVVPFTTIIDQNADEVRKILEPKTETYSSIVLEHHSNLTPDEESWRGKILSENWGAPVIFTTSVQLLETLFNGGTRSVRRMHQLANSLIIFDEIQALPIKCVHMFNNSINFLVETCGSSVVLCTATQPLLNKVDIEKGACNFNKDSEIVPDVKKLFDDLKRVITLDARKTGGFSDAEIADYAIEEMKGHESCLVIANTKKNACNIYKALSVSTSELTYHLSTDLCPAHRKVVLDKIRKKLLEKTPLICVSTQLIEAGVDVDFGAVIRCMAGIDSIAQAAGRCNRHGLRVTGRVIIVNNRDENLSRLTDIEEGKKAGERVLSDLIHDPSFAGKELLSPAVLERFFTYYFYNRKKEMDYQISVAEKNGIGRNGALLDLLSDNEFTIAEYLRVNGQKPEDLNLNHSFAAAGKIFKAIDAPTRGIIVPFGEDGTEIINDLCSAFEVEKQYKLLKKAQQFSVNLFPWRFEQLYSVGALREAQPETGIYYLDQQFYDNDFGISNEPINPQNTLIV
jgi:CRISPR-associated endonuclease/helicase Cas3